MRIYPIFKIILAFLFFFQVAAYSAAPLYFIKNNKTDFTKDSINSLPTNSITSPLLVPILDIAPKITAVGNQTYCPGTSLKIVTDVVITDPDDSGTDAIYIQISSGYINGQDILTLNLTGHPTIATNWDIGSGKLKISSTVAGTEVSYNDLMAAIKDVEFSNSSATPSGIRNFSISIGQANYLPRNGHFYEFVPNLGITWTASKVAAETSTYYGMQGYLVTITASDEAKIAGEQASGAGWIGGSDAGTEGIWKWMTGPELGTLFSFTFWNNNEPNNVNNYEHYAHITAPGIGTKGSWNDLSDAGDSAGSYQPKGYIVEYGGMPGDPVLEIAASTSIIIPQTTGTTSASRCGSGIVTLQATASNGTIKWYDAAINGSLLTTGNSYTTPILSATTTYYVEVECTSRIPVVATIKTIPSITAANTPVSRCGAGSVTLQATADIGTINWYSTPTGGSIEATGTSFIVPNSTASTTYYAEAVNNGCVSTNRTPIDIIIYTQPISTPQEVVLCKSGVITLDALLSGMTYLWSTGETTQKIVVSTAGTYIVNVTSPAPENCTITNEITVIEHNTPEIDRIDVSESTVVIYLKQEEVYFEYSVDGINYQSSNVFFNAPSGFQTAYVREINHCSYDTENFTALIIPKFFTPNSDTYNDYWEVKGLINYPEAVVNIYDRYGKLITQLNASNLTWDGTLNKNLLPASDYWYVLKIDNTRPELRGHFSLKR